MSAHSGEGDHSFRRMAPTYSDPWRPGWRGVCGRSHTRRSRSPSHQQLLLSATSAVEARDVTSPASCIVCTLPAGIRSPRARTVAQLASLRPEPAIPPRARNTTSARRLLRCMSPHVALVHRLCTEQSTGKVEWIPDAPFRVRSSTVGLWGMKRRAAIVVTMPGCDPHLPEITARSSYRFGWQ